MFKPFLKWHPLTLDLECNISILPVGKGYWFKLIKLKDHSQLIMYHHNKYELICDVAYENCTFDKEFFKQKSVDLCKKYAKLIIKSL